MATMSTVKSKAEALGKLALTGSGDAADYMETYDVLFSDRPENTLADHQAGVPMRGYQQGSSEELQTLYKFLHLMCTLGSVEKMYLPPTLDLSRSVKENQELTEIEIAHELDVAPDSTLLDLGCGCGAIARSIGAKTRCIVHGVNIEASQIEKANKGADPARLRFQLGDFNEPLPFRDEMFDGVYNVQALTYATDLTATLKEAFRVMKPGTRMVTNDVATMDAYDSSNPKHRELIQHTRELTVFGGFWHAKYWEDAFTAAGFEILRSEGRSAVDMIIKERALYDRFNGLAGKLASARLIPRRIDEMLIRMNTNCGSYIEAEQQDLLTLNHLIVARKPG